MTGTPRASVSIAPPSGRDFRAGDTVQWTVSVENRGDAPFKRLRAWTVAEKDPLLDRREFVFGTVRPGEKRSWAVPVKIPKGTDSRRDQVTLHFEDDAGKAPSEVATSFGVVEAPKPAFAFSVQLDDRAGGNGDGLAQRGETFTVRVDVRNVGEGASGDKTYVSLKNLGDEKMFIKKGRDVIGALKPGETKSASMEVELRRGSKSETLPFRVMVIDEKMDEYVSEKLDWPVAKDEPTIAPSRGSDTVAATEAVLRTGASPSAAPIATARKGAVLPADAKVGDFWRVEWQKGRFAFAADGDDKPLKAGGARAGAIAEARQREPPRRVRHGAALGRPRGVAAARRLRLRERSEGLLQGRARRGERLEARVPDRPAAQAGQQRRHRVRARGRGVPDAPLARGLPPPARRGGRGRREPEGRPGDAAVARCAARRRVPGR